MPQDSQEESTEEQLERLMHELSGLQDSDDLTDKQQGMIAAADQTVALVFEQVRGARHLNEWGGR